MARRSQQANSSASEREPLLGDGRSNHDDHEPTARHGAPCIYDRASVKFVFACGAVLVCVNLFSLLTLLTLLYHPQLQSPFVTSPLLQTNLHLVALLITLPSLLVLELSSSITRGVHYFSLALVLILGLLLASISEFRENGTTLSSLPALGCLLLSILWALTASRVVEGLQAEYLLYAPHASAQETGTPLRITIGSQEVQPWFKRFVKLLFASIGTTLVMALLLLLTTNTALDGYDFGMDPPGQKVWIDPKEFVYINGSVHGPGSNDRLAVLRDTQPFRLHMGVQTAQSSNADTFAGGAKPTALFFPPLSAVSGYTSSHWLRSMVKHGNDEPRGNGTKDGHLALERAVWFDLPGTGLSDYVRTEENLDLQAQSVIQGLRQIGALKQASSSNSSKPKTEEQFILVSLASGSLVSQLFTAHLPEYVHSQIFIDAETAESFYGDAVDVMSGLRVGYGADGRRSVAGRVWYDLVPALTAPLKPCRLIAAVVISQNSRDRVLGSRSRTSLTNEDGSEQDAPPPWWSSLSCSRDALVAPTSLLTRLSHDLDSSRGVQSPNYRNYLRHTRVNQTRIDLLQKRPTAVLSSFWKMRKDPEGWGRVQRDQIVRYAIGDDGVEYSSSPAPSPQGKSYLVGWWRVGKPTRTKGGGGDRGRAEGMCGEKGANGRMWCEEAVRKVLSWDQATNRTVAA
ncbi:unnamed protein product [Jaminaea pallidilutea]